MAVGAFIGSVPRAFVYTALGASIGNRSPVLAYAAIGVWCLTAIVGAFAAHSGFRNWRGHGSSERIPNAKPRHADGHTAFVPSPVPLPTTRRIARL